MATDALCVFAIWCITVYGYYVLGRALQWGGYHTDIGGYSPFVYLDFWPTILVFIACNAVAGLYHGNWMYPAAPVQPVEELRRLFGTSFLTHVGVIAFLAFAYQTTEGFSRAVVGISGCLVALLAQSFRSWARRILKALDIGQIPVMLAGKGAVVERIKAYIESDTYTGFKVERIIYDSRKIVDKAKKRDIKILLACLDERVIRLVMDDLSRWFTYIEYIPTTAAFPIFGARAVSFGGAGGIEMVNHARMKVKRFQKRVLDTVLSFFIFVLSLPVFVIVPLIIKLTSRGPVFYRADRLGRNGCRIRVWKFRSMYLDADKRLAKILEGNPSMAEEFRENFKLRRDPRITPFGRLLRRTSIDELPQLFNVLRGEMALIGPRPIVDEEVHYYGDSYRVFSSVRPGITGLWQVSGRSDTDYADRVALDSYYVLNWSPWLDFWILKKTISAVLLMRGAR